MTVVHRSYNLLKVLPDETRQGVVGSVTSSITSWGRVVSWKVKDITNKTAAPIKEILSKC